MTAKEKKEIKASIKRMRSHVPVNGFNGMYVEGRIDSLEWVLRLSTRKVTRKK